MNLSRFPRRRYAPGATPLEHLARLSELLGGPNIYIKRDDSMGPAGGGNKTRKLEFIVAEALSEGADTLITCGGLQSNHCRLTLAAAVKEGLKCRLVLEEPAEGSYNSDATGNNFLFRLLGVEHITVRPAGTDLMVAMQEVADELTGQGRKAYIIPVGASTPLGTLGYVSCAQEILYQTFEKGICVDRVVCASGSGGTQAGLVIGFHGTNAGIGVIGINVSRGRDEQEEKVRDLAERTCKYIGIPTNILQEAVVCFDDYVGPGYALPTSEMAEAVRLLARTEGVLLDPIYTGKAMAGLIDLIRKGYFRKDENILFVHTGGAPALYAYRQALLAGEA